uniref:Serine protease 55 n=1 Tax=Otolemur garnettii TaxID=30611 RepID=H0XAQ9_OTOGA
TLKSSSLLVLEHKMDIKAEIVCGERPAFEEKVQYSRIIDGLEAEVGEFPWQVSIQARNEPFCGGAILNQWWILTAAHCLSQDFISPEELNVVVGTNDLTSSHVETKAVASIIINKDFKKTNMDNDIALLLLVTPITFSDLKVPICLPTEHSPSKWHECWVAGWGQTEPGNTNSKTMELLKVPMIITDWEMCLKDFSKLTMNCVLPQMGHLEWGSLMPGDLCLQGDSGGPLVCTPERGGKWYQVGIISWGRSCGKKNTSGIYTALANYHQWILKVTQVEGRPFHPEEMTGLSKLKGAGSQASGPPEPCSLRLWFLLYLSSCVLFRAI